MECNIGKDFHFFNSLLKIELSTNMNCEMFLIEADIPAILIIKSNKQITSLTHERKRKRTLVINHLKFVKSFERLSSLYSQKVKYKNKEENLFS